MERTGILPDTLADSNLIKAAKLRALIREDIIKPTSADPLIHHLNTLHVCTVQLCSTKGYPAKFRRILEQALLDVAAWKALQEARTLNWCKEVRKQFPLKVSGEGNRLLHSISLYMWGVQDTDLDLQKTFHEALVKTQDANFKLRLWTEYREDPTLFQESEIWDQEWLNVIKSADPRSSAGQAFTNMYQDVHIFVLANIIRRPIVVIVAGNSEGRSKSASAMMTSSPAGIYLPLHWPPYHCHTYPILLSYVNQHFTPLIDINDVGPEINAFPLVVPSKDGSVELPIRFLLDTEKGDKKKLLNNYLTGIPVPDWKGVEFVNAARLFPNPLPDDLNLVQDYFQLVNHQYIFWQQNMDKERSCGNEEELAFLSNLSIVGDKCLTRGCTYFCSKFTKPFCHMCHDAFQKEVVSSGMINCNQSGSQGSDEHLQSERTKIFGLQEIRNTQSTPSPPASHIPFFNENSALKCKTSQCPFTGSVTQNGLCQSCFQANHHLEYFPEGDGHPALCFPKSAGEIVEETMDLWGERCSNCKQEIRKFNGLCFSCLKPIDSLAKSHARTKHVPSESLASTGSYGTLSHQDQGQTFSQINESGKCRNPNCQYFGTEEQNGFCTTCFLKYVEEIGASSEQDPNRQQSKEPPPSPGDLAQISSHLKNMSVCCKHECSMLANPVYNGYCEKCYVDVQRKHFQRLEMVSDIPTEQHAWSPVMRRCPNSNPSNDPKLPERTTSEHIGWETVRSRNNSSGHLQSSHILTSSSSDQRNAEPKRILCRTHDCKHFGNEKCDGYCNACFTTSQMFGK
ncbi:tumor necrosis factor alpha-induced protein 3-like isoform X1 [Scyliorhinus torazame]|uniref:tumor necrosis factor alpha-induced protein 3-like isoform X1 n=1 Tax=Scyliorhinus torazame TaxID=75743 RepID=UPI003B5AD784